LILPEVFNEIVQISLKLTEPLTTVLFPEMGEFENPAKIKLLFFSATDFKRSVPVPPKVFAILGKAIEQKM